MNLSLLNNEFQMRDVTILITGDKLFGEAIYQKFLA